MRFATARPHSPDAGLVARTIHARWPAGESATCRRRRWAGGAGATVRMHAAHAACTHMGMGKRQKAKHEGASHSQRTHPRVIAVGKLLSMNSSSSGPSSARARGPLPPCVGGILACDGCNAVDVRCPARPQCPELPTQGPCLREDTRSVPLSTWPAFLLSASRFQSRHENKRNRGCINVAKLPGHSPQAAPIQLPQRGAAVDACCRGCSSAGRARVLSKETMSGRW